MELVQVYRVWAGALPLPEVYARHDVAEEAASDAGGMTDGAFFRARACWALRSPDGRYVLLDECTVAEPEQVVP